jgi:hypothetical protein
MIPFVVEGSNLVVEKAGDLAVLAQFLARNNGCSAKDLCELAEAIVLGELLGVTGSLFRADTLKKS